MKGEIRNESKTRVQCESGDSEIPNWNDRTMRRISPLISEVCLDQIDSEKRVELASDLHCLELGYTPNGTHPSGRLLANQWLVNQWVANQWLVINGL